MALLRGRAAASVGCCASNGKAASKQMREGFCEFLAHLYVVFAGHLLKPIFEDLGYRAPLLGCFHNAGRALLSIKCIVLLDCRSMSPIVSHDDYIIWPKFPLALIE